MNQNELKSIFVDTILSNKKLKKKASADPKPKGSLCELLEIKRSQSFYIILGTVVEDALNNIIRQIPGVTMLNNTDNHRQLDIAFSYEGRTYYFESKNNVNLDTEKTHEVKAKLDSFREKFDICGLVSIRAPRKEQLYAFCKGPLRSYLYGYNDLFEIFGIEVSDEIFREMISSIDEVE